MLRFRYIGFKVIKVLGFTALGLGLRLKASASVLLLFSGFGV